MLREAGCASRSRAPEPLRGVGARARLSQAPRSVTPHIITGLGICSAIGTGREAFFRALESPTLLRNAPRRKVESFDASQYDDAAIAEVPDFDPAKYLGDK